MSNEVAAAERWLYSVLTGDATLAGIVGAKAYGHVVPVGVATPFLLWTSPGAADDVTTFNAIRIWAELIYAVRIVNKVESYIALETAAAAVDEALHRASGSNVSGDVVACVRQAPFTMIELDPDGSALRHLGGIFRLHVQ